MIIELENEEELDNYIICHKCHTLQKVMPIQNKTAALCSKCNMVLYRKNSAIIENGLAMSIAGLMFFVMANLFPLIQIDIFGTHNFITIISMVVSLIKSGYFLVAFLVAYLVIIFPLLIFLLYLIIFVLLRFGKGEYIVKRLLILLAKIEPWHMSDIFLVSILVAAVKLFAMAQLHIGISFWALFVFVLINIYISKNLHLSELWMVKKNTYENLKQKSHQ